MKTRLIIYTAILVSVIACLVKLDHYLSIEDKDAGEPGIRFSAMHRWNLEKEFIDTPLRGTDITLSVTNTGAYWIIIDPKQIDAAKRILLITPAQPTEFIQWKGSDWNQKEKP